MERYVRQFDEMYARDFGTKTPPVVYEDGVMTIWEVVSPEQGGFFEKDTYIALERMEVSNIIDQGGRIFFIQDGSEKFGATAIDGNIDVFDKKDNPTNNRQIKKAVMYLAKGMNSGKISRMLGR